MDSEKSKTEDEEDLIPSSQGEFFSSQSSTPDLDVVTPSQLVPVLQPSQSDPDVTDTPLRSGFRSELVPTTPSESIPRELSSTPSESTHLHPTGTQANVAPLEMSSSSSVMCEPDVLASTPSEMRPLQLSATPTEIRLDLSTSPSVCDLSEEVRVVKRPRSSHELSDTPCEKRPRTAAAAGADDSDIQFVEEVPAGGDGRVLFTSQEAASVVPPPTTDDLAALRRDQPGPSRPGDRPGPSEPGDQAGLSRPGDQPGSSGSGDQPGPSGPGDQPSGPGDQPPALEGDAGDVAAAEDAESQVGFSLRFSQSQTESQLAPAEALSEPPPAEGAGAPPRSQLSLPERQSMLDSCAVDSGGTESEEPGRLRIDTQESAARSSSSEELQRTGADCKDAGGLSSSGEPSAPPREHRPQSEPGPAVQETGKGGEARLPHIATPVLTSNSNTDESSGSSGRGSVFRQTQKLIERQNEALRQKETQKGATAPSQAVAGPAEVVLGSDKSASDSKDSCVSLSNGQSPDVHSVHTITSSEEKTSNGHSSHDNLTEKSSKKPSSQDKESLKEQVVLDGPLKGSSQQTSPLQDEPVPDAPSPDAPSPPAAASQTGSSEEAVSPPTEEVRRRLATAATVSPPAPEPADQPEVPGAAPLETTTPSSPGTTTMAGFTSAMVSPGHTAEFAEPEDPYQFHGTQSQATQPLRPLRPARAADAADSPSPELTATLSEMDSIVKQGYVPQTIVFLHPKSGQERSVKFDEQVASYVVASLQRQLTSPSTTSTSTLSTSSKLTGSGAASSGYSADRSGSSASSSNKRMSTLSSMTLSTIEGRGARLSMGSSVDAGAPAARRRRDSVISVQQESPGSDVEVLPIVPEFVSPDGRPPRPHGQPAAVSSLFSASAAHSEPESSQQHRRPLSQVVSGLESPPAATSTQAETAHTPSGAAAGRARTGRGSRGSRAPKKVSFSKQRRGAGKDGSGEAGRGAAAAGADEAAAGEVTPKAPAAASAADKDASPDKPSSEETHVSNTTGSTSPEIERVPTPLPSDARPLSDAEEAELSEREVAALRSRTLEPDLLCFALWVDQSYYPGRLVSCQRDGRWLVQFDDLTRRQVSPAHVLPVDTLWKGLSVFVRSDDDEGYYESAIITGHRMSTMGDNVLEYIVSLDSRSVTCLVSRSRLLLTRDQAAVMADNRTQPTTLALGSPARALSLDNLVSGRRRAGPAGRRLPGFDTSSGQDASDADSTRRPGAAPGTPRRRGSRAAKNPATPTLATVSEGGDAGASGTKTRATRSKSTPGAAAAAVASPLPRRGSRARSSGTPAPGGDTPSTATPGGRGRKRSAPASSSENAPTVETPSGRGRRRLETSTPEEPVPATVETPSGRGRKRLAASTPEDPATVETPSGRGRKRAASDASSVVEAPAADKSTASSSRGRKSRKPSKRLEAAVAGANTSSDTALELARPLDEFPLAKSDLFKGLTFILTCVSSAATPKRKRKRDLQPPYDKQHVAEHVQCRGGRVLSEPSFTADQAELVRRTGDVLLLSNGPLRTAKYISCLAMGVPCVSTQWLVSSVSEGTRLPYQDFLLPAGELRGSADTFEQRLCNAPPLTAVRALVAGSAASEWGATVAAILAAAGAEVKLDDQDPDRAEVPYPADVVVAPPDCPPPVLRWADTLRLPVVSSEWAIASVITYSRQSYQGRPEFRHTWRAADDA